MTKSELFLLFPFSQTEVSEFVKAMAARVVPFLARLEGVAPHRSGGLLKDYMHILSKVRDFSLDCWNWKSLLDHAWDACPTHVDGVSYEALY